LCRWLRASTRFAGLGRPELACEPAEVHECGLRTGGKLGNERLLLNAPAAGEREALGAWGFVGVFPGQFLVMVWMEVGGEAIGGTVHVWGLMLGDK
jgi:hypothetical protein